MRIRSFALLYFGLLCLQSVTDSARGNLALNAPGIALGSQSATFVPFRNTSTLLGCYKFIFLGTEAKGSTVGGQNSLGSKGNGGVINYKAFVSSKNSSTPPAQAIQLTFVDVATFNSSPLQTLLLCPAAVFTATTVPIDVDLVWQGDGSGKQPNGFFNILGEVQKDPPPPTGTLYFPNGMWELKSNSANSFPSGTATIIRN